MHIGTKTCRWGQLTYSILLWNEMQRWWYSAHFCISWSSLTLPNTISCILMGRSYLFCTAMNDILIKVNMLSHIIWLNILLEIQAVINIICIIVKHLYCAVNAFLIECAWYLLHIFYCNIIMMACKFSQPMKFSKLNTNNIIAQCATCTYLPYSYSVHLISQKT